MICNFYFFAPINPIKKNEGPIKQEIGEKKIPTNFFFVGLEDGNINIEIFPVNLFEGKATFG